MMMSQKVRVFGLKTLFLNCFTVRPPPRRSTLIIDKTDHSAFTAIKYIPGPKFSSSLFGVLLLLLRFPRILTGESYYSTS